MRNFWLEMADRCMFAKLLPTKDLTKITEHYFSDDNPTRTTKVKEEKSFWKPEE